MFWTVVRVEARNLRAERALWGLLALLAALVAGAAWSGAASARARQATVEGAVEAEERRLAEVRARLVAGTGRDDPGDPVIAGRLIAHLAVLPPAPLAALARGQGDADSARVTTDSRLSARGAEAAIAGPTVQATGAFDLAFVFVYLLPLLIIGLTYDLLAGERERGTLALVLAQPVSLRTFVLGKACLRAAVVVGVTLGLAAAALALSADGLATPGGLAHTALYLGALLAYALFWFAAAVAVNARGRTAAGNALALVGVWLVLVVAVPGLVRMAVEVAYPPPSRVELANLVRDAASEIEEELTALQGDHGAAAPAGLRLLAVQEALDARIQPVVARFRDQLAQQQRLVNRLRFLSPALVLNEAVVDLAGTGGDAARRFDGQVDAFHGQWRAFFAERARAGQRLTPADLDGLPTFAFVPEPLGDQAARVGLGVLGLLLPALALLLMSAPGLRRVGRLA